MLKPPTPRPPSKTPPATPSPPQANIPLPPSVLSVQFHTQKSRNARQKKQTIVQRPNNLLVCSLLARLPCSGRAQKNALYHLTIIINSVCPVSSIDRPPRGTVRLRIEPITPPVVNLAPGAIQKTLRRNLNRWTPQNISPCRCPTLPNLPAHSSFAANKFPPSIITNKKYTKTPQRTGINNS